MQKAVIGVLLMIPGVIIVWEGGKRVVKKGINWFNDLKNENTQRIEDAKAGIKSGVLAAEMANNSNYGKEE